MRAKTYFAAVDSHTEGMPTRVITGGLGPIPGDSMQERRLYFEEHLDHLRLLLMREPRGHSAMSGAFLQPPTRPDADWGVLFVEVSGLLPMCGHGTIGVATVLVETGMVAVSEPETVIRLDTPAGLVEATVTVSEGRAERVRLRNVPAFVAELDATVEVESLGALSYDMAFGGNFYALMPAASVGLEPVPANAQMLIDRGLEIISAINAAARPVHPVDPAIGGCKHVVFYAAGTGRRGRARRDLDPPRLARPLPVRHRNLGTHGGAPRPRRPRHRPGVRQRIDHRQPFHGAPARGGQARLDAGGRARGQRPRLDHRHEPVPARPDRPVPDGLLAVGRGSCGVGCSW